MSNYRRNFQCGATYFFTVNLLQRKNNDLLVRHIDLLRQSVARVKRRYPFDILGFVVLPEHLHAIWQMPHNDSNYSLRWRLIKSHFSKSLPKNEQLTISRQKRQERGIWQRRFWEHTIRDDKDLESHMDYLHYNPVKHGYVKSVADWEFSTFHYCVEKGIYRVDWGSDYVEVNLSCMKLD